MAETLDARLTFLVLIIGFSLLGVVYPFWSIKRYGFQVMTGGWMVMLQCFAVGLVCGVALLHVLADAQEYLEKVSEFPVANAVCLFGSFFMVSLNRMTRLLAVSRRNKNGKPPVDVSLRNGSTELLLDISGVSKSTSAVSVHCGHVHEHMLTDLAIATDRTARYKAYLMELAIAVHSVLVGLGLGIITKSAGAVITLGIALCFHQLFEGVALGMVGANAGLKGQGVVVMIIMFVGSCPLGIVLGICLESGLDQKAAMTNWMLGGLNALAAGTLLEIGFVELLPEAFGHSDGKAGHKDEEEEERVSVSYAMEFARLFWLTAGGGVMVFLAIWA